MHTTTLSLLLVSAMALGTPVPRGEDKPWSTIQTHLGYCLDVTDGVYRDGTSVQFWACANGNPNQDWTGNRHGAYYVKAPSGKIFCLDSTNSPIIGMSPTINSNCDIDNPAPRFTWTDTDNGLKSSVGNFCLVSTDPVGLSREPPQLAPCQ